MSTNYPNDYDSYPTWQDLVDIIAAAIINNIQDAIVAIEHELGKNPSGDFSTVKERLDSMGAGGMWAKVEEVDLTAAATEYTFSGLDGDNDKLYKLIARVICGVTGYNQIALRFNGDTGNNYGWGGFCERGGSISGNVGASAAWCTIMVCQYCQMGAFIEGLIYPVSGHERQLLTRGGERSPGYAGNFCHFNGYWENDTDNITSITILSTLTNGLGAGTHLELWKRT